jgi:uncharacterized membrane protein YgcG
MARLQLTTYRIRARGARGRVTRALLAVTDAIGARVPGANVTLTWSHIPEAGGTPSFQPSTVSLLTSAKKKPKRRGTILVNSPFAVGRKIRLTINAVTKAGSLAAPPLEEGPATDLDEARRLWAKRAAAVSGYSSSGSSSSGGSGSSGGNGSGGNGTSGSPPGAPAPAPAPGAGTPVLYTWNQQQSDVVRDFVW